MTHTCHNLADSTFDRELIHQTKNDILVGEDAQRNAVLFNNTLETSPKMGWIASLLKDGSLFSNLSHTDFNAADDRAMVCGSMGLNTDMKLILEEFGLRELANSDPDNCVTEKAFVG